MRTFRKMTAFALIACFVLALLPGAAFAAAESVIEPTSLTFTTSSSAGEPRKKVTVSNADATKIEIALAGSDLVDADCPFELYKTSNNNDVDLADTTVEGNSTEFYIAVKSGRTLVDSVTPGGFLLYLYKIYNQR